MLENPDRYAVILSHLNTRLAIGDSYLFQNIIQVDAGTSELSGEFGTCAYLLTICRCLAHHETA